MVWMAFKGVYLPVPQSSRRLCPKLDDSLAKHVRTGGDTISLTYKICKLTALHINKENMFYCIKDLRSGQLDLAR